MYDIAKFADRKPLAAEGHFCIELTDPLTGKVKECVKEKNNVFLDSLFSLMLNGTGPFNGLGVMPLAITDSVAPIDTLPLLRGSVVGIGFPGQSGYGLYQGAYNALNQEICVCTTTSARWKYQYDFTTAQANGVIGTIGLTRQYTGSSNNCVGVYSQDYRCLTSSALSPSNVLGMTCDGRYAYICSSAGVITKYDNYTNISSTIDVSAVVGNTTSSNKCVGYNATTGNYYVIVYSSTASLRKVHVFTDNTFNTCTTTHACTNLPTNFNTGSTPYYVYNNFIYKAHSNAITSFDFVNDITGVVYTIADQSALAVASYFMLEKGSYAKGTYIIAIPVSDPSNAQKVWGAVFDMATASFIAYVKSANHDIGSNYSNYGSLIQHPCYTDIAPCVRRCSTNTTVLTQLQHTQAVTAKKLDTPITKTSANGLTITYELEVFW